MTTRFTVGMEVVINPGRRNDPYEFSTVASVTPSGRIVTITDGRKYNGSDGHEWGSSSDWYYEWIEPLTDDVRTHIAKVQAERVEDKRRKELRNSIGKAIEQLNAEQLQQISDLISTFPKEAQ